MPRPAHGLSVRWRHHTIHALRQVYLQEGSNHAVQINSTAALFFFNTSYTISWECRLFSGLFAGWIKCSHGGASAGAGANSRGGGRKCLCRSEGRRQQVLASVGRQQVLARQGRRQQACARSDPRAGGSACVLVREGWRHVLGRVRERGGGRRACHDRIISRGIITLDYNFCFLGIKIENYWRWSLFYLSIPI